MSQDSKHLIGSVFERKTTASHSKPLFSASGKTGFPSVQHRSKSAFARGRNELRNSGITIPTRVQDVPVVIPARNVDRFAQKPISDPDSLRRQISEENERRVNNMTEEERDEERREILERFGGNVGDILKKARETRERQVQQTAGESSESQLDLGRAKLNLTLDEIPVTSGEEQVVPLSMPSPALSTSSTRPSSRADRRIRFAELTPKDVHVYESAPPSPRRKALALPPPGVSDDTVISLGQWKGNVKFQPDQERAEMEKDPEEGTPEYIRQCFFPNIPAHNPSVAWIESSSGSSDSALSSIRFDLSGAPISAFLSSSLPTHLGLHHHADGSLAGYTLDDVFLLSRSTVPAQRTAMLGVLSRIANKLGKMKNGQKLDGMDELEGKEEELRKRIVAVGIEALNERGSLGARAVEVVWECIVGWDEELREIEGVELIKEETNADTISSLPLDFILPKIATLFSPSSLPSESLTQLLAILHRLAQHSNSLASTIIVTPELVANVMQTSILTPIPLTSTSSLPDPAALQLLTTLALASRSNALSIAEPADALLRFVTMLPPTSPFPSLLATVLLTYTLRLYTVLASYGLYSHIATTGASYFTQIATYVLSDDCRSRRLMCAWAGLLEAWMVCATDPHRTTPGHEILWSQVVGWGWGEVVLELGAKLSAEEQDWEVWAALWRAEAAWLEGAQINSVRSGEAERLKVAEAMKSGFESGKEQAVLSGAIDALKRDLEDLRSTGFAEGSLQCVRGSARGTAMYASTIMSALRLWLACLPPRFDGPLASPPFTLPFRELSKLCAALVNHSFWSTIYSDATPPHTHVFCRSLTALLSYYLRLSRRLPSTSQDLWIAQALAILRRLLPGDEEAGIQFLANIASLISPEFLSSHGWTAPSAVWDKGGLTVIKPFLVHTIQPLDGSIFIGPFCMSSQSILVSTTQRLPPGSTVRVGTGQDSGLPLKRDWMLSALDHLLHSGSSSVLKSLPPTWDVSETEITRASFLFAKVSQETLRLFSLNDFMLTREEAVLGCMKVFMLEHGQPENDSTAEVFRDSVVSKLMEDLLSPYAIGVAKPPSSAALQGDLEKAAIRFLGPSTPFYQYYTDFVALYDAISFSHPLFARLLLPPTSMRYPPDYRRHLWNDFGHILKTIRTPIEQVITGDLREYIYPVERDAQMISLYLKWFVKGSLEGCVHFFALHHLASNIWPDLQEDGSGLYVEERAGKLLTALVDQGAPDIVREVVLYRQARTGPILLPPTCFEDTGEWKIERMICVERWLKKPLAERLSILLRA